MLKELPITFDIAGKLILAVFRTAYGTLGILFPFQGVPSGVVLSYGTTIEDTSGCKLAKETLSWIGISATLLHPSFYPTIKLKTIIKNIAT
jgi:hypothetical protein